MSILIAWLLLLAPAGVVLGAALSKLVTARVTELPWPTLPLILGRTISPHVVIALELAGGTAATLMPSSLHIGILIAALYGALAWVALSIRGQRCACFGVATNPVGWVHVLANATVALYALPVATYVTTDPAPELWIRIMVVSLIAVGTVGVTLARLRRSRAHTEQTTLACTDAHSILILTMPGCPACSALEELLAGRTGSRIRFHQVVEEDDPMAEIAQNKYPAAVGLDANQTPMGEALWGINDIKGLTDRFIDKDTQTALL